MKAIQIIFLVSLALLAGCDVRVSLSRTKAENTPDKNVVDPPLSGEDISISPGWLENLDLTQKSPKPLDLMFAIDVSGSMESNIDAIKRNIGFLTEKLLDIASVVRVGGVAFRDDIASSQSLTNDTAQFKGFLNSLKAQDGWDANEAALLGIQTAVTLLDQDISNDSDKALFVFTDNPGHNGNGFPLFRDCSLKTTQQLFLQRSKNYSPIHFFYSVSNNSYQGSCGGFSNILDQMQALVALVPVSNPKTGQLSFPLNDEVLQTQFLKQLAWLVESKQKITCSVDSAKILSTSGVSYQWSASGSSDAINTLIAEGKQFLLPGSGAALGQISSEAQLEIQYCCRQDQGACSMKTQTSSLP